MEPELKTNSSRKILQDLYNTEEINNEINQAKINRNKIKDRLAFLNSS